MVSGWPALEISILLIVTVFLVVSRFEETASEDIPILQPSVPTQVKAKTQPI